MLNFNLRDFCSVTCVVCFFTDPAVNGLLPTVDSWSFVDVALPLLCFWCYNP